MYPARLRSFYETRFNKRSSKMVDIATLGKDTVLLGVV